jgi:benzoyl-CoA reductase/2-hydroxyglutaryl-CoA dehydratase subunit BcrC/BadD/HgdB
MERPVFDPDTCPLPAAVPRVGVLCSYTPEEVIYAAGLQPVRLLGSGQPVRSADSFLHNNLCPYVRGLFDEALAGSYDDCPGVVFVNSCDAMRRLHDVWRHYGRQSFVHIVDILRVGDEDAIAYFADQLRALAGALAAHFGTTVTDDRLFAAIRHVNQTRRLVARLYELRTRTPPALAGAEAFPILLAGVRSDQALFQSALARYLDACAAADSHHRHRGKPRLLISGSVFHHPHLISLAEDAGAVVVAEDFCVGHRHYAGEVVEDADPFQAIARRYVRRAPCSRMKDLGLRHAYLESLIDDFQIDGVVYHSLKFCDLYQYDFPLTQQLVRRRGLPILYLETDFTTGSYGQLKTRLQAFVEVLG